MSGRARGGAVPAEGSARGAEAGTCEKSGAGAAAHEFDVAYALSGIRQSCIRLVHLFYTLLLRLNLIKWVAV